ISSAVLSEHALDVPFSLIYLFDSDSKQAHLAGSSGVNPGAPCSPMLIDLNIPEESKGSWPVAQIIRSAQTDIVDDLEYRFGGMSCGPYPEMPKAALILPIPR